MTSGALSPYNTFYPQYPQGYSHRCLLSPAGHYPHIDSYSAVLASMGSHAQHVSQSQLPRSFMPTHISQYSPLSNHRNATPTTSPTSGASIRHSPKQQILMHRDSPKSEQIRDSLAEVAVVGAAEGYGHAPHGLSVKEEKSHSTSQLMQSRQLSPLSGHSKSVSVLKEPSMKSDLNKDMGYKLPSGKEGSLKHRILIRPSNNQINECPISGPEQILSTGTKSYTKSESISPAKRSKSISEMAVSDSDSGCGQSQSQCTVPPQGIPNVPMIPHLHYPPHFMKGSIIQLANGDLKRVEDLQTDDFIHSAKISADLKIDSSTVVRTDENIERGTTILSFLVGENKVQVTVEATLEHPFFVFGQGWSSCCPQRTIKRYGLDCHKLSVGDVCISLTHKEVRRDANRINYQQFSRGVKIEGDHHSANTSPMLTDNKSAHLSRHRSPPAAMGPYQRNTKTHSAETQTNLADNNNNDKNSSASSCSSGGNNDDGNQSVGQSVRKRRWSAPGKMNLDSLPNFMKSSLVKKLEPEIQNQIND